MQSSSEFRQRLLPAVLAKTAAGRAEVERRSAALTARQRAVLILLDGRRSLDTIDTWLAQDEMLETAQYLLERGLVAATGTAEPAASPAPAPLGAAVVQARTMMLEAARTHLGLMASDLVRRIEHAADARQLAGVLGLWHVSLCGSKTGKPHAEGLLAAAKSLLG